MTSNLCQLGKGGGRLVCRRIQRKTQQRNVVHLGQPILGSVTRHSCRHYYAVSCRHRQMFIITAIVKLVLMVLPTSTHHGSIYVFLTLASTRVKRGGPRVKFILIKPTHHANVLHWFTSWFKWLPQGLNQFNSRLKWCSQEIIWISSCLKRETRDSESTHAPLWLERMSAFYFDLRPLFSDDGLF